MPPSVMGPAAETVEGGAVEVPAGAAGPRRIELTGTVGSCGCEICNTIEPYLTFFGSSLTLRV